MIVNLDYIMTYIDQIISFPAFYIKAAFDLARGQHRYFSKILQNAQNNSLSIKSITTICKWAFNWNFCIFHKTTSGLLQAHAGGNIFVSLSLPGRCLSGPDSPHQSWSTQTVHGVHMTKCRGVLNWYTRPNLQNLSLHISFWLVRKLESVSPLSYSIT